MNEGYNWMFSVREIAFLTAGSAFLTAWAIGTIMTSLMCRFSWRLGVVDKPDGLLKRHHRPIATLGGVPLFAAILAGVAVIVILGHDLPHQALSYLAWNGSPTTLALALLIILTLGIRDDIWHVMPRAKLLFQVIAATVLIGSGVVIQHCDFFGVFGFSLGLLAVPFTLFWLVGSCNAFNFIDGMDGLASGVGLVISLVLALLGFVNQAYGAAILSLAIAGSLLAILLFNFNPARIFLGDSGSQLLGLLFGMLSIKVATINGIFALPCAGLILSLPVMDALLSILRRYSKGESIAQGDHHHIHHCLRRCGLSVNETVVTLWSVALVVGIMGFFCCFAKGYATATAAAAFVILEIGIGARLGCLQVTNLLQRLAGGLTKFKTATSNNKSAQRIAEIEALWNRMKPLFEQTHLDRAVLTLESVNCNGRPDFETFQWARSEVTMAELLRSRWTKRFSLEGDQPRIATLRLESANQIERDEQRIDWLLQQISENMRRSTLHRQMIQENNLEEIKT